MSFDYYYGQEADQFAFFRLPKVLITDEKFRNISSDAKLLYGLMLDRMGLSLKNEWLDTNNRVYIIYTIENIIEDFGCSDSKAKRLLAELDTRNIGLIETKRQGLGKPNLIYVKNFLQFQKVKSTESDEKVTAKADSIKRCQKWHVKRCQIWHPNNTKDNNYKKKETNVSKEKVAAKKSVMMFGAETFEMRMTDLLIAACKEDLPTQKSLPDSEIKKGVWAVYIHQLLLNGYTEAQIELAMNYAIKNEFWKAHIRSTKKFKEKFETLLLKAKSESEKEKSQKITSKNKFNNFEGRSYDLDDLEVQLLNSQKKQEKEGKEIEMQRV